MDKSLIERGKQTYGIDVGIILLDADLPRPPGDVAHGATFRFPIHYEVTSGASVPLTVERSAAGLLPAFVDAGRRALARGASILSTSCGFLAIYQRELADALDAPMATSTLLQISLALRILPSDARLGLLTVNAQTLGEKHFRGVGISEEELSRVTVFGMESSDHFYNVVVGERGPLDINVAEREVVDACVTAVTKDPAIRAFVFECNNLSPYSSAVRSETRLPVWDSTSLINWLHDGVSTD